MGNAKGEKYISAHEFLYNELRVAAIAQANFNRHVKRAGSLDANAIGSKALVVEQIHTTYIVVGTYSARGVTMLMEFKAEFQ